MRSKSLESLGRFFICLSLTAVGAASAFADATSYFCEYVDASGISPVDTGYAANAATKIYFKGAFLNHNSVAYVSLFKDYRDEQSESTRVILNNQNYSSLYVSCFTMAGSSTSFNGAGQNGILEGWLTPTGSSVNGTEKSYTTATGNLTDQTVKLHPDNAQIRIYYFRAEENDVVICDWRPYVKEGTVGYLNFTTGEFRTATTGSLTAGPAIEEPSYDDGRIRYQNGQWSYKVTVAGTAGGTVQVVPAGDDGWYDRGAQITLTATADDGYSFRGWTGTGLDQAQAALPTTALTVSSPIALTAHFGQPTVRHWRGTDGTSPTLASVAANWYPEGVPETGDTIAIDEDSVDRPMTWDVVDVKPAGWTQSDYSGTVTFMVGTSRAEAGSLAADGVNRELHVTGNVTINSGSWTSGANSSYAANSTEVTSQEGRYRLWLTAGGNVYVGANATVDVSRCGFYYGRGAGVISAGTSFGHGGTGTDISGTTGLACYGNLYEPAEIGSGGNSSFSTYGAGAVKIVAGGSLTVDGLIDATPSSTRPAAYTATVQHYPTCGGSIWLTAASMSGSGKIRANSGSGTSSARSGGGRVALYLTGNESTFDNLFTVECYGSPVAGTIYRELAGDTAHHGELMVIGRDSSDIARKQMDATNLTTCTPLLAYGGPTDYNFRKLSLFGGARLAVTPEVTLDLTDTVIEAGKGTKYDALLLQGGRLVFPGSAYVLDDVQLWITASGSTIAFDTPGGEGTLTLKKNSRFDAAITIPGSLVLEAGTMTHTAQGANAIRYAIDITTTGDLTIGSGAGIKADSVGYSAGPGHATTANTGASYGGFGYNAETQNLCYGDPRNPTEPGSAGGNTGGGLVKLNVAGRLQVNGTIAARGTATYNIGGSGGAINVTAGEIAGAGAINASSMNDQFNGYSARWTCAAGGGGGRVAITLTKTGATFDDYTGTIEVARSANNGGATNRGGNGTIYLRLPGQAIGEGTLIIDAKNLGSDTGAGIDAATSGYTVGNVVLRNGGKLDVRKGCTLNVKGDFSNDGTGAVLGEAGDADNDPGEVAFVDAAVTSRVTGVTTFAKLSCTEPGKTLRFGGEGSELIIGAGGYLDLRGSGEDGVIDEPVYLRGLTDGDDWKLSIADGAQIELQYLDVAHSDASESPSKPSARDSVDSGGNRNWAFVNIKVGERITWTGDAGTGWGNPGSWDLGRAPVETDTVVIPDGCGEYPQLSAGVTVHGLEMAGGSTLALDGFRFTVTSSASIAGTLVCSAAEQIEFLGDVDFTGGGFTAAASTVTVAGTAAQAVNFAGLAFDTVVFANAGVATCGAGFSARRLFATAGGTPVSARFAADAAVTVGQLYLDGGSGVAPQITLAGVDEATWKLAVTQYSQVRGVAFAGCNATGGRKIWDDAPYTDNGGNSNVGFSAGAVTWTGGGATSDFADADNWSGGAVPTATDRVALSGGEEITFAADAAVGELVFLGGVTQLTATDGAKLSIAGSLYAEGGSKCFLDVPVTAGSALVRSGAFIVHTPCTTTAEAVHSIDLAVSGDMEIEPEAYLDALARGSQTDNGHGTGSVPAGSTGAAHGGYVGGTAEKCYGSAFAPVLPGSGGNGSFKGSSSDATVCGHGGGVIRLQVGGTLLLDGVITADGWTNSSHYAASGGSVWVTVGRLKGTGGISARGGLVSTATPGAGGRVAVYRTAETEAESAFTGTITARGGGSTAKDSASTVPCGSVYLSFADTPEKGGVVVFDNGTDSSCTYSRTGAAAVLPARLGDEAKDFKNATIRIGAGAGLVINADMQVKDVELTAASARLVIPDVETPPVLTVSSRAHRNGSGWVGQALPGRNAAQRYDYVRWLSVGTMLILR